MNGRRVLEKRLIWSDRTVPDDAPIAVRTPCVGVTTGLLR